jgi:Protein of unknown function (DUF3108)
MKSRNTKVATIFMALTLISDWSTAQPTSNDLNVGTFAANYSVEYRGIKAGTLDFILRKQNDRYVYESIAHPRGVAKLVVNNNLREASEFTIDNGNITPQNYELDDGSASTKDDTRLKMNWQTRLASGQHENRAIELPLTDGVQDRMSAQVVVMQYLLANKLPEKITFIDRDALKEYAYSRLKEEKLKTQLGELETIVIASSRIGSNRITRLWYAPSLGYLPVRGEQERKGKIETVFQIQSFQR